MKTKENLKQNKAITLVALVVTVIVLLILATITILELKNTKLFSKTVEARNEYKQASGEENNTLDDYTNKISSVGKENSKDGKNDTTEPDLTIYNYTATGMVEYDAGSWTQEEINQLKSLNLYNINVEKAASSTSGLNLTFGGFTYKGDTTNASYINDGTITTSRNKSIASYCGKTLYTPTSDGWMVLEWGETSGTKRYVKKLVHAGAPENYVHYTNKEESYAYLSEYILSGGTGNQNYAPRYNSRSFDMYKDTSKLNMIEEVHCMTDNEAYSVTGDSSSTNDKRRKTGASYWTATAWNAYYNLQDVLYSGERNFGTDFCWGIRPVVTLKSGVYVDTSKHNGTGSDKYVLEMD